MKHNPNKYTDLEGCHHSSLSRMCAKYGVNHGKLCYMVNNKGYSINDALRELVEKTGRQITVDSRLGF